ncbi:universal stress protein [Fodinibius halophilus]|uniref:Universal stress protein n=1 Tax=Fodinibius halophilus TaxID=1736908 RepID=A0A6M1T366_9BACT|nr:universal stress protein [Fodinibius halophilus]NGP89876.1 universal stress protein [Fodinibius halophilus]
MNIKNILVPTDFSNCSEAATSFAIDFAIAQNARLYLMHSMKSSYSMTSERLLEKMMEDDRFKEVKAQPVAEIGDPGSAILRESKEVEADLLIMGNKGSSGGRNFLGSTTTEVITKSEIPVLTIPEESSYSGFDDILFMTDFKEGDLSALKEMLDWVELFRAHIHVVHISTDDNFEEKIKYRGFKEAANEYADYEKLTFERVVNPSFYDGFLELMEKRNPDLITATRYKKTFFQKLLQKNHTRMLGYEADTPFLSLNGEKYL